MTNTQRVDVARLSEHWRSMAKVKACPSVAADMLRGCADDLEAALPALLQQLADWDRLLQAVVLSGFPKDLPVEVPSLWPFNGGQDAAMVAFALHTARERAEAAERAREEACWLLRKAWRILDIDAPNDKTTDRIATFLAANGGGK